MNETVQDLINSGLEKVEAIQYEVDRVAQNCDAFNAAQRAVLVEKVLALMPGALRQYVKIEERGKWVEINAPGCANIICPLRIKHSIGRYAEELHQWVSGIESVELDTVQPTGGWVVQNWFAYYGEDGWEAVISKVDRYKPGTDDIEIALAEAAGLGDNRADVEKEVLIKKYEADKAEADANAKPKVSSMMCPLMDGTDCVRERCALWIGQNHVGACSLQVLASKVAAMVDFPAE